MLASSRRTIASWPFEQLAPPAVADLRRALGRSDDVGEHDGREDAIGLRRRATRRVGAGNVSTPLLPENLDVRGQTGDVDQVEIPLPHHLVGNAVIPAPRVPGLGRFHRHG
jgi:hypothetical protein